MSVSFPLSWVGADQMSARWPTEMVSGGKVFVAVLAAETVARGVSQTLSYAEKLPMPLPPPSVPPLRPKRTRWDVDAEAEAKKVRSEKPSEQ